MKVYSALFLFLPLLHACTESAADTGLSLEHRLSVNDVMVGAIAPASNTLWGVGEPRSDEDWKALDDAAVVVVAAGTVIAQGGSGPNDMKWANDTSWRAFAQRMVAAGIDSRNAVRERDLDALLAAGEVLYPPCEECHAQFHPGLQ